MNQVKYFRKFEKMTVMDLQTRKLNLISYLAQLQDEIVIERIEKFILRKQKEEFDIEPFTVEELIQRIEKSENNFKKGKYKTQEEIEKLSAKW
ncbi:hypothetical protein [Xanthomarina gelatinilytica]|jgi:hypothetical protein